MNEILNSIASVVVLLLTGSLTAFFVILNLYCKKEIWEGIYAKLEKQTKIFDK